MGTLSVHVNYGIDLSGGFRSQCPKPCRFYSIKLFQRSNRLAYINIYVCKYHYINTYLCKYQYLSLFLWQHTRCWWLVRWVCQFPNACWYQFMHSISGLALGYMLLILSTNPPFSWHHYYWQWNHVSLIPFHSYPEGIWFELWSFCLDCFVFSNYPFFMGWINLGEYFQVLLFHSSSLLLNYICLPVWVVYLMDVGSILLYIELSS